MKTIKIDGKGIGLIISLAVLIMFLSIISNAASDYAAQGHSGSEIGGSISLSRIEGKFIANQLDIVSGNGCTMLQTSFLESKKDYICPALQGVDISVLGGMCVCGGDGNYMTASLPFVSPDGTSGWTCGCSKTGQNAIAVFCCLGAKPQYVASYT